MASSARTALGYRLHDGENILMELKPQKSTAFYFLLSKLRRMVFLVIVLAIYAHIFMISPNMKHVMQHVHSTVDLNLVIAVGVVVLLIAIYCWMRQVVQGYGYVITNERIILKFGFVSKNTRMVPYSQLADVNIQASSIERLCGVQSINIDTVATAMNFNRRRAAGNNTNRIEGLSSDQAQEAVELISQYIRKR